MTTTLDLDGARALHEECPVIDLHADTPKLMDVLGLDLARRHVPPLPGARYLGHVDIPRMRDGGLAAQFFGMWTFPYPRAGCAASVHRQLDAVDAAVAKQPDALAWCRSAADVLDARAAGRIAILAGIEGGQALEGSATRVADFAQRGVRYLGLLHFTANDLGRPAKGVGADPTVGISPLAHDVIAEMDRLGVVVDLAHINRKGFFEALAATRAVPIVSHTGVAGVFRHWRNLDDEQLRGVADRGGAVGVIFAPGFLGADGVGAVCDHLAHVLAVGGEDTPALGSDFDGMVRPPKGLTDVAALPVLTATLLARGIPRRIVAKLLGGNVLRVLREVPTLPQPTPPAG